MTLLGSTRIRTGCRSGSGMVLCDTVTCTDTGPSSSIAGDRQLAGDVPARRWLRRSEPDDGIGRRAGGDVDRRRRELEHDDPLGIGGRHAVAPREVRRLVVEADGERALTAVLQPDQARVRDERRGRSLLRYDDGHRHLGELAGVDRGPDLEWDGRPLCEREHEGTDRQRDLDGPHLIGKQIGVRVHDREPRRRRQRLDHVGVDDRGVVLDGQLERPGSRRGDHDVRRVRRHRRRPHPAPAAGSASRPPVTEADVSLPSEPPSTGTDAGPGVGSSRSSCQPRNVSQTRQNEADPEFDVPHVVQTWSAIGLLDDEAVCDVGRLGGLEERVDAPAVHGVTVGDHDPSRHLSGRRPRDGPSRGLRPGARRPSPVRRPRRRAPCSAPP